MFEPSASNGSITQHPSAPRKNTQCFTEETQLGQINSTTVNVKLSTLIRYVYSYKTYSHAVFTGFFAGVYLGSRLFLFRGTRQFFHPNTFTHFSTMASEEHTYAIPDSTVTSLRLLCGPDFNFDWPDAVPFHVTEMDSTSTTDTGEHILRTVDISSQRRALTSRSLTNSTLG